MNRARPVVNVSEGAVSRRSRKLQACLTFILGAFAFCAIASAAPAANPAAGQAKSVAPSEFVGSDTCATCHEETAKGFASNPHTKMALMHGKSGVTCENCHGAGKAHVDGGGDTTKIFNPAKASTKEVDKTCLTCHAGQHANFERSQHAKANVGCISCHSIHKSEDKVQLLKTSQSNLCFQCHTDVKPQFSMPFHHKVNEGVTNCSDCHDPHGTFQRTNLKTTADQNAICTKCHTDTRGPFVFEHTPVRAEGCMACHTPHGSQNARLLNMPNVNELCRQCHNPVGEAAVHGLDQGSTTVSQCISCHTMIHGSNASQAFIR